jgi:ATP-dependent 26S proteasome regulatory subunit
VDFGVLKKLMPARITDLIGQPNLLRTKEELSTELMPDPSYFDVRQAVVELIGLPLGSQFVKERIDKLHYFLFFGPHGSGKTLIIRALASECDALVLELSPLTLEPKINDKKELNKMLAMTFNVAKTFPPAIIYMDEVENIFKGKKKKKKGAGGAAGPNFTKLRKTLTKYKKKVLKKEDRVAVIASTNKPW